MCKSFTITYLLCLHAKIDTKPCTARSSILSLFRWKCDTIKTEVSVNDFCSACCFFWDSLEISAEARRALVNSFRIVNACHSPLTPVFGSIGEITFRIEPESQMSGRNRQRFVAANQIDDVVTRLSMLNAASWVLKDNEEPMPAAPTRSRRDSVSSSVTIWPDPADDAVEDPWKDTVVKREGFEHEIDMENLSAPQAMHLPTEELVDPDKFQVVSLDEELPGQVHGEWFEHQSITRPITPLPTVLPDQEDDELFSMEFDYQSATTRPTTPLPTELPDQDDDVGGALILQDLGC